MLKTILAKRSDDFCIQNNLLVIKINGGVLNLSPSDIKDIWLDQKNNSITIAYKLDKVTLNLVSSEKYQKFSTDFLHFFSNDQFHIMKRHLIRKLISGCAIAFVLAIYLYLNHFNKASAIIYLLLGLIFFSINTTYFHIKSINSFFERHHINGSHY